MKKIVSFVFTLFLLQQIHGHSFITIEPINTIAISGNCISRPIISSYGFIFLTDGRSIESYNSNGKKNWEKFLNHIPGYLNTLTSSNLLYTISSDKKYLTLLNPDGNILWEVFLTEGQAEYKPLLGHLGLVFIQGKDYINCYDIHGKIKWFYKTEKNFSQPALVLNDGSLLCITDTTEEKTDAFRLSPEGIELEKLFFEEKCYLIKKTTNGVIILFENGKIMYNTVENNKCINLWSIDLSKYGISKYPSFLEKNNFFYFCFDSLIKIEPKSGKVTNIFSITEKTQTQLFNGPQNDLFLLFEEQNPIVLSLTTEGVVNWIYKLRTSQNLPQLLSITNNGIILYPNKNWTVDFFNLNREVINSKNEDAEIKINKKIDILPSLYNDFSEKETLSLLIHEYKSLGKYNNEKKYSPMEKKLILHEIIQSGYDFSSELSELILLENDTEILLLILEAVSSQGIDPYHYMIEALYKKIFSMKKTNMNDSLFKSFCDASYSICEYMGSSVFTSYGKQIFSYLLSPICSSSVRTYTKQKLNKLLELYE